MSPKLLLSTFKVYERKTCFGKRIPQDVFSFKSRRVLLHQSTAGGFFLWPLRGLSHLSWESYVETFFCFLLPKMEDNCRLERKRNKDKNDFHVSTDLFYSKTDNLGSSFRSAQQSIDFHVNQKFTHCFRHWNTWSNKVTFRGQQSGPSLVICMWHGASSASDTQQRPLKYSVCEKSSKSLRQLQMTAAAAVEEFHSSNQLKSLESPQRTLEFNFWWTNSCSFMKSATGVACRATNTKSHKNLMRRSVPKDNEWIHLNR